MSFGKGRIKPLVLKAVDSLQANGENRRSTRRQSMTPGLIYPGGTAASIPCVVIDQSATGARLKLQSGWVNPFRGMSSLGQTFNLVMRLDRMEVICEIIRIEENELGVRFTSVMQPMTRKM
jgi:hypothetical protein